LKSDNIPWPSILQFGFSLFACLVCWAIALFFILGGVSQFINTRGIATDTQSFFLLAAGAALGGVLLLPSAGYALAHLLGREAPSARWVGRIFRPSYLIFLFPVVLFLGFLISRRPGLAWWALPPVHLLAVGLPILWIAYIGWRGLSAGSSQRLWGVFGSGLVLGPALIMVLEFLALGVILFLGIMYVAFNPTLLQELTNLSEGLKAIETPEEVVRLLQPYLAWPSLIYMIFAFISVIVPVIEELLKPVGVWFLVGSNLSPAEGFVAGLLSGAGYALFENLALTTVNTGSWVGIILLRIGTGMLHIMTAALVGWALALAWTQGRYLRLAVTYLLAVLIHGLWNGLALLTAATDLSSSVSSGMGLAGQVGRMAYVGLVILAVAMFIVFFSSNVLLRRANQNALRSEDGVHFQAD
jgi:hypothetical protein